jgi:hypothetical protein
MEPFLVALTPGELAEAIRDYVARKHQLSSEFVAATSVKVSYNTTGPHPIAAVAFLPVPAPAPKDGV